MQHSQGGGEGRGRRKIKKRDASIAREPQQSMAGPAGAAWLSQTRTPSLAAGVTTASCQHPLPAGRTTALACPFPPGSCPQKSCPFPPHHLGMGGTVTHLCGSTCSGRRLCTENIKQCVPEVPAAGTGAWILLTCGDFFRHRKPQRADHSDRAPNPLRQQKDS